MLRAAMTVRTLLLLGGIGAAIAAAQPAAAQTCSSGYYFNPVYGCLVAGVASRPLPFIISPSNHDFAHPNGRAPQGRMVGGGTVAAPSLSTPHAFVPPVSPSTGFAMSHSGQGLEGGSLSSGSLGHSSMGGSGLGSGGGFSGGGFSGGGFGGGGFGGGHGR